VRTAGGRAIRGGVVIPALLVEDFLVGLGAYETTDVRDYLAL
jgi:hypothetical protein